MDKKSFEDGREFESLVRQFNTLYQELELSRDRGRIHQLYRGLIDEIYNEINFLSDKYSIYSDRDLARLRARYTDRILKYSE